MADITVPMLIKYGRTAQGAADSVSAHDTRYTYIDEANL